MGLTRASSAWLGGPAQHKAISAFFELCPTPSAFMEATARPETVLAAIKPLGLFDQRMIGLVAVSPTATASSLQPCYCSQSAAAAC